MKNVMVFIAIIFLCACNESKDGTIQFKPISESELNYPADSSFALPHGKIWDERKRTHDSCIGSSYAANAVLMRTRDSISLASIVDMKTMKVVRRFPLLRDSSHYLSSLFSFDTKPCYERRRIEIPIDSFMNQKLLFKIDSSDNKVNHELMDGVQNSVYTEIETGSWLNMELNSGIGKKLDTTTDENLLAYKKTLLTPGNMILVRSSAVMDINFYFHTKSSLPDDLVKRLLVKPVSLEQTFFKAQFVYIDSTTFELKLNGFFQAIGQFMKCETE